MQCAYKGELVPCELVPTALLDSVELTNARLKHRLEREQKSHSTTLDMFAASERARAECAGTLSAVSAQRDKLEEDKAKRLPTWAKLTMGAVLFGLGAGAGIWVGTKL